MGDDDRTGVVLKFIATLLIILSLGTTGILIVLKIDGLTAVADWSWMTVILPALSIAGGSLVLWAVFDYLSLNGGGGNAVEAATTSGPSGGGGGIYRGVPLDAQPDIDREQLRRVSPVSVEAYHEGKLLRDLLLICGYTLMLVYATSLASAPCSCTTPYALFSSLVAILYGLRIASLLWQSYREFDHLRRMAVELRYDHNRFYDEPAGLVVKDMWLSSQWSFGAPMDGILFAANLLFAAVMTFWRLSGVCETSCGLMYETCAFTLFGVYTVEAMFILSTLLLQYARRKTGVEAVQRIVMRVTPQKFPRLARMIAEKKFDEGVGPINHFWLWVRNGSRLKEIFQVPDTRKKFSASNKV